MIVVDDRTTRKNNNKYQTTNIIYDQNSNEIKLASDKTSKKQFNLYVIRKDMGPVLSAIG